MEIEDIYRRYFRDVYRFVLGLSQDGPLAEELTQETFFKALKALNRFDGTKDIRAWLFTIARNAYYDHCRAQKSRRFRRPFCPKAPCPPGFRR